LFPEEENMVQMTMQVSEELAERLRSLGVWLPTVLELSLVGFKTVAAATATEVIEFLSQDPTPQDILNYHASDRAQTRLQRLLTLNAVGMLGETEQLELDELQRIEHIIIMLKAQVTRQMQRES
jgi:glutamate/tyrosine decarboxylase-like PLP-dependent enzyme